MDVSLRRCMMDQRTCGSYSLPCLSFPVFVEGLDRDAVGGDGLQALDDGGGHRPWDLQDHFFASSCGDVPQAVVEHLSWSGGPGDLHGALCLMGHGQLFVCSRS